MRVRGPLDPDRAVFRRPRLLLFSRNGFTDELVRRSRARGDVELIDMERLYNGG